MTSGGPYRDDPTGLEISKLKQNVQDLQKKVDKHGEQLIHIEKRTWMAPVVDFFKWLVYVPKRTITWLVDDMGGFFMIVGLIVGVLVFGHYLVSCVNVEAAERQAACQRACAGMHQDYVATSGTSSGDGCGSTPRYCSCADETRGISIIDMRDGRPRSPQ